MINYYLNFCFIICFVFEALSFRLGIDSGVIENVKQITFGGYNSNPSFR